MNRSYLNLSLKYWDKEEKLLGDRYGDRDAILVLQESCVLLGM